jgi:hypothetical protein
MKKKTLKEELLRIHGLTYGEKVLNEDGGFIDRILNFIQPDSETSQKTDDPLKADLVSSDVNEFYNTLESIKSPVVQQTYGSMVFQKNVETVQIGLILTGYELPRFGVDGLFGPETAATVRKFKKDNNLEQSVNEAYIPGIDEMVWNKMPWGMDGGNRVDGINWSGHDTHIHFGFTDPQVAIRVMDKCLELGLHAGENPYTSKVHQVHVSDSFHYGTFPGLYNGKQVGKGLDVSGDTNKMKELFNWVATESGHGGEVTMTQGGNEKSGDTKESITPEMVTILITKLKQKNITSEDIKKYIDPIVTTGGGENFTDLDLHDSSDYKKYTEICNKFITRRNPEAHVTGEMMASAAKKSFDQTKKYLPPELALAQLALEGGLAKGDNVRPIKTKNPFNVGNTKDSSRTFGSYQEGVDAYYSLVCRNYLDKGKTASDLIRNFVNRDNQRYDGAPADSRKYENDLTSIAREANRISRSLNV